jgi:hypothetical protein
MQLISLYLDLFQVKGSQGTSPISSHHSMAFCNKGEGQKIRLRKNLQGKTRSICPSALQHKPLPKNLDCFSNSWSRPRMSSALQSVQMTDAGPLQQGIEDQAAVVAHQPDMPIQGF